MTVKTKGVQEWADISYNFCQGCPYECEYCYARKMDDRFGRDTIFKVKDVMPTMPANNRVMLAGTHDIADSVKNMYPNIISQLIERKNFVLVVSKADPKIMKYLAEELTQFKEQIEFRITITSLKNDIAENYEKKAPLPYERLKALEILHENDYNCSISCEPMLFDQQGFRDIIYEARSRGAQQIWLGALSFTPGAMQKEVKKFYTAKNFTDFYHTYKNHEFVQFKDTFLNRFSKMGGSNQTLIDFVGGN